jgi:hypothetical protein
MAKVIQRDRVGDEVPWGEEPDEIKSVYLEISDALIKYLTE